jgi:hypothetical protein
MAQTQHFRGVETTTYKDHDGALVGVYRGTPVAKQLGNIITLNTGGWKSNTTKTRMNQFSNTFAHSSFGVVQRNYDWFVLVNGLELPFNNQSITFEVTA